MFAQPPFPDQPTGKLGFGLCVTQALSRSKSGKQQIDTSTLPSLTAGVTCGTVLDIYNCVIMVCNKIVYYVVSSIMEIEPHVDMFVIV